MTYSSLYGLLSLFEDSRSLACRVVCRPFDKFFNSKEAGHKKEPVDWTSARVYEKVDGSLIKCYFYKASFNDTQPDAAAPPNP